MYQHNTTIVNMDTRSRILIQRNRRQLKVQSSLPIHYVGLGGSGSNGIEYLQKKGIAARFSCITSPHQPAQNLAIDVVHYPGIEDQLEIEWYDKEVELTPEIKAMFRPNHQYVLFCGLGGYTGTILAKKIYRYLMEQHKTFKMVVAKPFLCEGPNRQYIANRFMDEFSYSKRLFSFDLEQIKNLHGDLTLRHALDKANETFYELSKK